MKELINFIIFILVIMFIFFRDSDDVEEKVVERKVIEKKVVATKTIEKKVVEKKVVKPKPKPKPKPLLIKTIKVFSGSSEGDKVGQLNKAKYNYPTRILSYNNKVFIIDEGNKKIKVIENGQVSEIILHHENKFTKKIKPININKISSLAIMDNKFVILDYWKSKIYYFSLDGSFESKYKIDYDLRLNKPLDLISASGKLFIADSFNNKIKVIENNKLSVYAGQEKYGSLDGDINFATFNKPSKIRFSNNIIYILDSKTNKIRLIKNDNVETLKFNVNSFAIHNNDLYLYNNQNQTLTKYNVKTKKIKVFNKKITFGDIYDMEFIGNEIIFSIPSNHKLYKIQFNN